VIIESATAHAFRGTYDVVLEHEQTCQFKADPGDDEGDDDAHALHEARQATQATEDELEGVARNAPASAADDDEDSMRPDAERMAAVDEVAGAKRGTSVVYQTSHGPVPISAGELYASREVGLAFLNGVEFDQLVHVVCAKTKEEKAWLLGELQTWYPGIKELLSEEEDARGDIGDGADADSTFLDVDDRVIDAEDVHTAESAEPAEPQAKSKRGRRKNARYLFVEGFDLTFSHYLKLKSKWGFVLMAGAQPPRVPTNIFRQESLTKRDVAIARYYGANLIPWSITDKPLLEPGHWREWQRALAEKAG
jgi:hypothetical protein